MKYQHDKRLSENESEFYGFGFRPWPWTYDEAKLVMTPEGLYCVLGSGDEIRSKKVSEFEARDVEKGIHTVIAKLFIS